MCFRFKLVLSNLQNVTLVQCLMFESALALGQNPLIYKPRYWPHGLRDTRICYFVGLGYDTAGMRIARESREAGNLTSDMVS